MTTDNYVIRTATINDVPEIYKIQNINYPDHYHEAEEIFISKINTFPDFSIVLLNQNSVIGYLIAHPWHSKTSPPVLNQEGRKEESLDLFHIHDLALLPEYQSKGLGKKLVDFLLERLKQLKVESVTLISVQNTLPFWKSLGFDEQESHQDHLEVYEREILILPNDSNSEASPRLKKNTRQMNESERIIRISKNDSLDDIYLPFKQKVSERNLNEQFVDRIPSPYDSEAVEEEYEPNIVKTEPEENEMIQETILEAPIKSTKEHIKTPLRPEKDFSVMDLYIRKKLEKKLESYQILKSSDQNQKDNKVNDIKPQMPKTVKIKESPKKEQAKQYQDMQLIKQPNMLLLNHTPSEIRKLFEYDRQQIEKSDQRLKEKANKVYQEQLQLHQPSKTTTRVFKKKPQQTITKNILQKPIKSEEFKISAEMMKEIYEKYQEMTQAKQLKKNLTSTNKKSITENKPITEEFKKEPKPAKRILQLSPAVVDSIIKSRINKTSDHVSLKFSQWTQEWIDEILENIWNDFENELDSWLSQMINNEIYLQ